MTTQAASLLGRVESLRLRIRALAALRQLVDLPPGLDITNRQWVVLESQLKVAEARLLAKLNGGYTAYGPRAHTLRGSRTLNALLGEIELDLSRAFTFFDTYMDVLTQRHAAGLGPLLAGCDVLAREAIKRDHPALALAAPPLVSCERGFGAAIIRQRVSLPDSTPNPMPLIQIPYTRLKEKANLTSILHEAGHQALVHLGLVPVLAKLLRAVLTGAVAPSPLPDLFALWSSEIGPDLWTFGLAGLAAAAGLKEILALPPDHVWRVAPADPHPPPYLRVLLAFEWCRQVWGQGEWDRWEREWTSLYPLAQAAPETRKLLERGAAYLPLVAGALLRARFRALGGKTLMRLFNLSALNPVRLRRVADGMRSGALNLRGLPPCTQLAVFRLIRQRGNLSEEAFDRLMTEWLVRLGRRRTYLP